MHFALCVAHGQRNKQAEFKDLVKDEKPANEMMFLSPTLSSRQDSSMKSSTLNTSWCRNVQSGLLPVGYGSTKWASAMERRSPEELLQLAEAMGSGADAFYSGGGDRDRPRFFSGIKQPLGSASDQQSDKHSLSVPFYMTCFIKLSSREFNLNFECSLKCPPSHGPLFFHSTLFVGLKGDKLIHRKTVTVMIICQKFLSTILKLNLIGYYTGKKLVRYYCIHHPLSELLRTFQVGNWSQSAAKSLLRAKANLATAKRQASGCRWTELAKFHH
ncbi:hypothetical protein Anapl_13910 [Anas platyrhynchos]|uniref:Uncharacterized protein n=1 Tax=Anas platyrhynchos TaxID=8839 RepID=R0LE96_ANAPL|nr:hypothetical protein Anapl_13910 [Anas platyrhynchos]